ncbi:MAG: phosphoribosylaminoimidazolesuccinocarboxamide synthase [Capsulimonadaceae bacterium]
MKQPILSTDIAGVPRFITGKVRDVYDLGDALLLVTTDRISAFDVVLPNGIPDKGRVLTQLSAFWFHQTEGVVANHLISTDIDAIAHKLVESGATNVDDALLESLEGRSLLGTKCKAVALECVVRGYLAGSAWADYRRIFAHGGEVLLQGHPLPVGLRESDKLPSPLFTPTTKATTGHDESVTDEQAIDLIGSDLFRRVKEASLEIYQAASEYAAARGIIIADTKFEFGLLGDTLILIDEVLTPDSSRFWDAATYKPGLPQPAFDKQYVRDYLLTLDWNKTYPGPELPVDVVENTSAKYREAYRRLTGVELP